MWSRLYVNAILETDSRKLLQRIREAEWAIRERLTSSLPIDGPEQELMTGARARLKSLKIEFNGSFKQMRRTVLPSKD
jgi:hypothetical protein